MKIKLLLLACLTFALSAQPSYTTISDTIYTPVAGVLFSGQVQISSAVPLVTTGSVAIAQWAQVLPVSGGVLRVRVVPNDTLTQANTSYVFRFTPAGGGQPWNEYCQIPTSGSPLKLSDVCATTPYSPPLGSAAAGLLSGYWPNLSCPTCEVTGHKDTTSGYPGLVAGKVVIGEIPTGVTGSTVPFGNDSRFSDARTPTVHATTHAAAGSDPVTLTEAQVTSLPADLALKAPLASPALTGVPTVPTAAPGTNTTQAASTAFAAAGLALKVSTSAVGANSGVAALDSNGFIPQAEMPRCTTTVSFSSTPSVDLSICPNQRIVLTGNVAPVVNNQAYCTRGCTISFVQGVAAYAVTWGANVKGGFTIGTLNGGVNSQTFTTDGTNLIATSYGAIDQ